MSQSLVQSIREPFTEDVQAYNHAHCFWDGALSICKGGKHPIIKTVSQDNKFWIIFPLKLMQAELSIVILLGFLPG